LIFTNAAVCASRVLLFFDLIYFFNCTGRPYCIQTRHGRGLYSIYSHESSSVPRQIINMRVVTRLWSSGSEYKHLANSPLGTTAFSHRGQLKSAILSWWTRRLLLFLVTSFFRSVACTRMKFLYGCIIRRSIRHLRGNLHPFHQLHQGVSFHQPRIGRLLCALHLEQSECIQRYTEPPLQDLLQSRTRPDLVQRATSMPVCLRASHIASHPDSAETPSWPSMTRT
jgi:hypothetical protein